VLYARSKRIRAYDMILRPSVCLSHDATAAPTCGGFAAERRAYTGGAGAQQYDTRQ